MVSQSYSCHNAHPNSWEHAMRDRNHDPQTSRAEGATSSTHAENYSVSVGERTLPRVAPSSTRLRGGGTHVPASLHAKHTCLPGQIPQTANVPRTSDGMEEDRRASMDEQPTEGMRATHRRCNAWGSVAEAHVSSKLCSREPRASLPTLRQSSCFVEPGSDGVVEAHRSRPKIVLSPARYVLLPLAQSITGYSVKAMERKMERGDWQEGKVWKRAPDRHICIDILGYEKWIEGQ